MNMIINRDLDTDTPTGPSIGPNHEVATTTKDVVLTSAKDIKPDLQPTTAPGVVVITTELDTEALEDALPMDAKSYYQEGVDDTYPLYLKVIIVLGIIAVVSGIIYAC